MASCSTPISVTKLLILSITLLALFVSSSDANRPRLTKTTFSFYNHFISGSGPNATMVPVAGLPGKPRNIQTFGTLLVEDGKGTETVDINSRQLIRNQGLFVVSALDGSSVNIMTAFVFTSGKYKGSSLLLNGPFGDVVQELAVFGGTGQFRYAKGYMRRPVIETIGDYTVERVDVTVLHYENVEVAEDEILAEYLSISDRLF